MCEGEGVTLIRTLQLPHWVLSRVVLWCVVLRLSVDFLLVPGTGVTGFVCCGMACKWRALQAHHPQDAPQMFSEPATAKTPVTTVKLIQSSQPQNVQTPCGSDPLQHLEAFLELYIDLCSLSNRSCI